MPHFESQTHETKYHQLQEKIFLSSFIWLHCDKTTFSVKRIKITIGMSPKSGYGTSDEQDYVSNQDEPIV